MSVISDKYAALGGPGGILGDSVSDEEVRADRRSHFQHYKNGSIYTLWTPPPSTPAEPMSVERAYAVQGPIHEKWKSLGFDAGVLGTVTTDERPFNDGMSRFHFFERGAIAWNATAGAHEVHGEIFQKWRSIGLVTGIPVSDELADSSDDKARYNVFASGLIYWTPKLAACEVHGAIFEALRRLGPPVPNPLGAPLTDELATDDGEGRFNYFVGGAIYYKPATGAHSMRRQILDKWELLGREKSGLGYPTDDSRIKGHPTPPVEPDHAAGEIQWCAFEGGYISWNPTIGAHFIRGHIYSKWSSLGGAERLGYPISDEGVTPDTIGRYNHFEWGSIYYADLTGAHEIHGKIRDKWSAMGWERSVLGYPTTDETVTPDTIGRYNHFQQGSIYYTDSTGAHEVHGKIRDKWAAIGWEKSVLGYPTTDETATPDTIGRYNHFQKGSVYYTDSTGAHEVHGPIRDTWSSLGWERSSLGYPVSDVSAYGSDGALVSNFQGGAIYWTPWSGVSVNTLPPGKPPVGPPGKPPKEHTEIFKLSIDPVDSGLRTWSGTYSAPGVVNSIDVPSTLSPFIAPGMPNVYLVSVIFIRSDGKPNPEVPIGGSLKGADLGYFTTSGGKTVKVTATITVKDPALPLPLDYVLYLRITYTTS